MYQRDRDATPGCLIFASVAFTVSIMFMVGTLIAKAAKIIE